MRADLDAPQLTKRRVSRSLSGALVARTSWGRPLYLGLGWLCVGMGALGVALPGLPTTPFMLIGLWCFSKSSTRFEQWLYHHRLFGPPLRAWRRHRVIALRYKLLAWGTMAGSGLYLVLSGAPLLVLGAVLFLMLVGAMVIARFPHRIPQESASEVP